MKFCKKIISLILAVLMATSVVVPTYASAYAAEQKEYEFGTKLLKENVQFLKETFLSDLDITKQDFYIEYLSEFNHEDEETFLTVAQDTVNRIQSKWSKVLKYLPSNISDSQFSLMGNNIFSYINGSIDVFKNFGYIKSDTRISQKIYHGLRAVNLALDMAKIPTGWVGATLKVLEKVALVTDFLYVTFMDELVQIQVNNYAQTLYIDYWAGLELNPPSKDDVAALNWSDEWVNNYYAGACEQYLLYSLKQMSSNYEKSSTLNYGKKLLYGGHTYQFFNTRFSSFEEAETYCESLGGHLAVIESKDEDKNVYSFLRSLGEMNAFLGVKKNTDGIWTNVYGNVLDKNSYTNWGSDEPNNEGGCEDVLQYYEAYPNGEWNDLYWGKQGIYSFICEWDEYIDSIPNVPEIKETHNFVVTNVAPTCTQNGYTLNKCKDCNLEFYSNSVYKLGHDFVFNKKVSPTCTAKGYDLYKCSRCSQTQQHKIVNELGHNYQYSNVVKPTCTEKGYDLYLCTRCGQGNKVKYVDALGHAYSEKPTAHKDPTCNSKGYDEYTCSRCNGTKRDEIAALDGSALTSALDNAKKKMESGVFTDESVSEFRKVYDKYKNAADEFDNQKDVDVAVNEITTAYALLVIKDVVTGALDNGMTWTFTKDGAKLSFAGEGEVPYYAIGSNPWYYCGNIETLEFGEGITSIAGSAFTKYNTVKKINFPSTLTTINIRAFEYCYAVEELVIPDSVTFIGYGTFASLTSLKKVTVPASVGYASYAFEHDEQVEKIIITPGVDGIMPECTRTNNIGFFGSKYTGAFGPWRVAKNAIVTVQDGITSIGLNTFYNAVSGNLTINVPASVNNIGKTCFATNGKTVAYVENGNCVIDETNLCSSNVNVMVKSENGEYAQKPHTHTWSDWHYNNDAVYNSSSDYKDGTQTRTCSVCGESETKEAPNTALLRRRGNALSLESSITLATYITKDVVDYYDKVYAEFTGNGKTEKVYPSDKTLTSNSTVYCIFYYMGISPQALGDNVSITFYGIKDGVTYNGNAYKYSATDYIKLTLNKPTSSAKLKTLLVDLVYYGEACQVYQNYKTDNLLTDILTDEQKAFHSMGDLNLTNIKNSKYSLCDNRLVKFGTALRLNNSVKMAIAMNMTNVTLEELSLKVKKGSRTMTYSYSKNPENFGKGKDGYWYFYFDGVYANQMSDEVLITAYKGSEQVSYTLKYSVESYAAIVTDAKIKAVTDAMMRYGNSAKAYVGK